MALEKKSRFNVPAGSSFHKSSADLRLKQHLILKTTKMCAKSCRSLKGLGVWLKERLAVAILSSACN